MVRQSSEGAERGCSAALNGDLNTMKPMSESALHERATPPGFGLRQSPGAFPPGACQEKAAGDCRSPRRFRVLQPLAACSGSECDGALDRLQWAVRRSRCAGRRTVFKGPSLALTSQCYRFLNGACGNNRLQSGFGFVTCGATNH